MPAFPVYDWDQLESGQIVQVIKSPGLSKREYFAVMALQGLIANPELSQGYSSCMEKAQEAVELADALLAELSKS